MQSGKDAGGESAGLVSARGTGDGLVLKLNALADSEQLVAAIKDYVGERQSFLSGNKVILDWVEGVPADQTVEECKTCLNSDFQIKVMEQEEIDRHNANIVKAAEELGHGFNPRGSGSAKLGNVQNEVSEEGKDSLVKNLEINNSKNQSINKSINRTSMEDSNKDGGSALFGGINTLGDVIESDFNDLDSDKSKTSGGYKSKSSANSMFWDNPDAMIINATLRSGQKIETENSIVLVGDLNSGAELVAGGDVIVLGTMRGVVHAGAFDETGGGRFIFALDLRPTQLRIGSVISRGAESKNTVAEIAYVDGNSIVVEQYNSRLAASRMR